MELPTTGASSIFYSRPFCVFVRPSFDFARQMPARSWPRRNIIGRTEREKGREERRKRGPCSLVYLIHESKRFPIAVNFFSNKLFSPFRF